MCIFCRIGYAVSIYFFTSFHKSFFFSFFPAYVLFFTRFHSIDFSSLLHGQTISLQCVYVAGRSKLRFAREVFIKFPHCPITVYMLPDLQREFLQLLTSVYMMLDEINSAGLFFFTISHNSFVLYSAMKL